MLKSNTITLAMLIILTGLVSLATIDFSNTAFAGTQIYSAQLSGDKEVPPIQTNTSGTAELRLPLSAIMSPQATVEYTVNVTDIENVTAAHIHNGQVGENGPIVVTLFKEDTPTVAMTTGVLSEGNITATNLEGPMAGKLLSNLTSAMRNEQTYVNVHTQQNPNGEIRGQILNGTSAVMITK
jgi:hypothetical protein